MTDAPTIQIVMPWPARGLSPNARLHWAQVTKLKKPYRALGMARAVEAMRGLPPYPKEGRLPVKITFHPPDQRGRDDDNMIGSFKAGRDGVAEAIGVNDRRWITTYQIAEPAKGGAVVVELPHPARISASGSEAEPVGGDTLPEWLRRSTVPPGAK